MIRIIFKRTSVEWELLFPGTIALGKMFQGFLDLLLDIRF